jgi:O-antigen ligase
MNSWGNRRLFYALSLVSLELLVGGLLLVHYAVPLLLILSLISVTLIAVDPRYGYLLCVAVLPFSGLHLFSIGDSSIELIQPVLAITLLAWFVKASVNDKERFKIHVTYIYLIAYLLWGFITIIWSESFANALWGLLKTTWVLSFIPFSVNLIKEVKDLRAVLWTWSLFSAVAAVFAFGIDTEATSLQTARSTGMALHPNILAMYLNMSIFLLVANFYLTTASFERTFIVLISILDFGALLATGSRGAFFGLICGLALVAFGRWRFRLHKPIFLLLAVGVLGFVLFRLFSSGDLYQEVTKRLQESPQITEVGTFVLRTMVWVKCYAMLKDSYFIGVGVNGYEQASAKMGKISLRKHPHNFYLHLTLELGIIGLAIFAAFLTHVAVLIGKSIRELSGKRDQGLFWAMAGGLTAFCVHAIVDFTFVDPELWFFSGITIAATEVMRERGPYRIKKETGDGGS